MLVHKTHTLTKFRCQMVYFYTSYERNSEENNRRKRSTRKHLLKKSLLNSRWHADRSLKGNHTVKQSDEIVTLSPKESPGQRWFERNIYSLVSLTLWIPPPSRDQKSCRGDPQTRGTDPSYNLWMAKIIRVLSGKYPAVLNISRISRVALM
jgi:hypothetical protein